MSAVLSPVFGAGAQLFTNQGVVLAGGKIYTYFAGTTSSASSWTNSTQTTLNANPVILDSAGRVPNEIWIQNGSNYKLVLTDSVGNTLGTWDNIPGINASNAVLTEWVVGPTPTYISSTSFSVPGNLVTTFQVNRRIQYSVVGGTFYGTITTSTYNGSTLTTVVFLPDSTGMDATLTLANYGFMAATNTSVPAVFLTALNPVITGTLGATGITGTADFTNAASFLVPTATAGDSTTKAASTAYVQATAFSAALPLQTGNSGKFVTTNGVTASWAAIPAPTGSIIYQALTQGGF